MKHKDIFIEDQKDQIRKIMTGSINTVWYNIKEKLRQSKIVLRGPSGYYANTYPELDLLLEFNKKYDKQEIETLFVESLLDDNVYIAAYCLVGLSTLHSKALSNLPKKLLERKELVEWSIGSMRRTTTLGYFAELYLISHEKIENNG